MVPEEIVIRADGCELVVTWHAGRTDSFDAATLWAECPSSRGRRRRLDDDRATPPAAIAITGVTAIGLYGVNIAFSDGHDRGIYPWPFLERLGAARAATRRSDTTQYSA